MRELKTLEVDRWEPSEKKGMLKHVGMISPQEAFDVLDEHLKKSGMLPDEYFSPNSWAWKGVNELPDYVQASCTVNWGGNEGIYLDISLLYRDEQQQLQRFNFATGKTLGTSGDDFLRMSRIAAECSMMLNGRGEIVRFYDDKVKEPMKEVSDKSISLWGRLGISLDVTSDELDVLKRGDSTATQLMSQLVKSDRITLNGETYFPVEGSKDILNEDLNFEFEPQPLHEHLKSESLVDKIAAAKVVAEQADINFNSITKNNQNLAR